MSKVQTDQKLELIRNIRMQNQYDRQILRKREGILYRGEQADRGEIYSLEETVLLPENGKYHYFVPKNNQTKEADKESDGWLKGLRVRLLIAMVLFLAFVYCDVKQITFAGKTMENIHEALEENQITKWLDYFFEGKEITLANQLKPHV